MPATKLTASAAGRPSHIVLFKHASEQNESMLAQAFGLTKSRAKSAASGITLLSARRAQGPQTKVFTRIAAAALDLDDEDVDTLTADASIAAVLPNELRTIPKPVPTAAAPAPAEPDDPMIAYLRGMRDAAELALRYAGALGEAERAGPTQEGPTGATGWRRRRRNPSLTWGLEAIGINTAERGYTGRGVKLAVLDTGLDLDHPDFEGRVVDGVTARSFVDSASTADGNGHGTHCSGLAAGTARPASGPRYGVAPDSELLIAKVLTDEGSGFDDGILEGMEWAIEQGAQILSMSLGSPRDAGNSFNQVYENIARVLLADHDGALIVAAAGNESRRPWLTQPVGNPAAAPSIMAVAAIDEARAVARFSCAQLDAIGTLDISAPGVDIHSAWTGGGYLRIDGTSMATPMVAGAAALWWEADPSLTPQELWDRLLATALPLGATRDFGRGLVQVPRR